MSLRRTVALWGALWLASIAGLHAAVNLGWRPFSARPAAEPAARFRVGFLPVTCHLTCPVTDFINRSLEGEGLFEPVRFNGWPELKEAFLSGYLPASFLLAPMALALREQGVPLKVVYLGHRDGTAMMVHRGSGIFRVEDLRGRVVAVPNRFSNQRLLLVKALEDRGMTIDDVKVVEMPPPDMPAALYARAVDAITSGEPFMGQTELDGYGRVLWLTKDVWPGFISCVLVVHEGAIAEQRERVQSLVTGIARSGKWIDQSMDHRMQSAQFVSRHYYNQHPRLLEFVLSKPPDRVKYTDLELQRANFEEIERLARKAGIFEGRVGFDDYADPSFVPDDAGIEPWAFEAARP
jgi:NitT/TauT family transport system substrate-binding protein